MTASFDYFGESFSYAEEFPAFEYAEFHSARLEGDDLLDADAQGYLLRLAVACVAEKDQARFRKLSRKKRARLGDWSVVVRNWVSEAAEVPTGGPTDSSDGPTHTPGSSESEPVASVTSLPPVKAPRGDLALAASRSRTA